MILISKHNTNDSSHDGILYDMIFIKGAEILNKRNYGIVVEKKMTEPEGKKYSKRTVVQSVPKKVVPYKDGMVKVVYSDGSAVYCEPSTQQVWAAETILKKYKKNINSRDVELLRIMLED